ncbi:hypothetical protein BCY84_12842 [Trypanosoma cruzi cruzi]|nr:hypothetical protein BCY84_12842 [Trypanosoma cruzi cruzi]
MRSRSSTAESARGTPSARTAQHPTSPFRRTASSPIGRTALTGQRSLHHPPCFPIGDDDTPTVVLGPNRKLLAWKKADWNKPSEVFSQLCRNTCDLTKMNSREERVVLGMRAATKATVPAWNHQPSPFWTPWLAKLDRVIAAAPDAEGSQRLDLRRREALREASKSRWHTLRSELEGTDGNSRQVVRPCLSPSFLEHASREIRWPNAQQTPEGQSPHEAVGGESNTTPEVPPSATDPDECEGPQSINMAEPGRPLRLLLLGPATGPDRIHGEALRHLGRVARRAFPWLFDGRLRAGTVPRNWRRVVVLLLPNPGKTASNRDPPPTCNAQQLPQQAHGTHSRHTHPKLHRVPVDSAAILLFAGKFLPRPIAAPQCCLCGPRQCLCHGGP